MILCKNCVSTTRFLAWHHHLRASKLGTAAILHVHSDEMSLRCFHPGPAAQPSAAVLPEQARAQHISRHMEQKSKNTVGLVRFTKSHCDHFKAVCCRDAACRLCRSAHRSRLESSVSCSCTARPQGTSSSLDEVLRHFCLHLIKSRPMRRLAAVYDQTS